MQKIIPHINDCPIYPGEYITSFEKEDIIKELQVTTKLLIPSEATILEFNDAYTIQLIAPGLKKEDFLVYLDDKTLSISILHKENNISCTAGFMPQNLFSMCTEQNIHLPNNAATEFISAEYRAGIMHLHIPKTNESIHKVHAKIVVY